ncbi:MAG: hypothetical protein IPM64_06950 [Phycisphaerales bacterium]|nr:hypothetical protein [Phycisphaerales bacterium]
MTLTRTIAVLVTALAVALTVVALRAEVTHLQFRTSELDREADALLNQVRERELELARLRNPLQIRAGLGDAREQPAVQNAPAKPRNPQRLPPRRRNP